jgi:hypothetical protein
MGNPFSKTIMRALTAEEKDHLVKLGTLAGGPGIVMHAIQSDNIFDPAHMEKAEALSRQWTKGSAVLLPYIELQKKREAEDELLIQMGKRMVGKPVQTTYAHLESKVTNLGKPQPDWFLRIQASEDDYADMTLGPYENIVYDCLLFATRHVPRFQAKLCCPEPVVIYEH